MAAARKSAPVVDDVEDEIIEEQPDQPEPTPVLERPGPVWTRTWAEVRDALDRPIPQSWYATRSALDRRSGSSNQITYIPWYLAARWLNAWADGWDYEAKDPVFIPGGQRTNTRTGEVEDVPGIVSVTVHVELHCKDHIIRRGSTAAIAVTEQGYGAATERAERAAFCRTFALLTRSALNLYAKE